MPLNKPNGTIWFGLGIHATVHRVRGVKDCGGAQQELDQTLHSSLFHHGLLCLFSYYTLNNIHIFNIVFFYGISKITDLVSSIRYNI